MTGGVLLEDDVFLILYGNGELMRYTYDPNTPAVPEIQLRAYSLTENGLLRTAISTYQSAHPEVYIRYDIGISESGAATREDALKKLNTEYPLPMTGIDPKYRKGFHLTRPRPWWHKAPRPL
ncbi:hypothetical protein IMSAGC014_00128 [Bacteroidaceae bacterium]|nr:hypothetical protein IMSAGC014_00128 [Bacteroidaceae bacterium]